MPPCPEIAGFLPTYASASDIEYSPAASWQKGSQVLSIPTAGQCIGSASALQPVQGSLPRFPDYRIRSPPESPLRSLPGNTPHLPLPDTKNQTDTACTWYIPCILPSPHCPTYQKEIHFRAACRADFHPEYIPFPAAAETAFYAAPHLFLSYNVPDKWHRSLLRSPWQWEHRFRRLHDTHKRRCHPRGSQAQVPAGSYRSLHFPTPAPASTHHICRSGHHAP